MKFGKNLQKIIELSDPAWSPYWPNYKLMKKYIKDLQQSNAPPVASKQDKEDTTDASQNDVNSLKNDPGEKTFFKLMHGELQKVVNFYEQARIEASIKDQRLREGMEITEQQTASLIDDKWKAIAKSVYNLYRDLLVLEIYCIMSFCAFSKALKKHDKVTGHDTRAAFMNRLVSKANFTTYPELTEMIQRCERLHKQVTDKLIAMGTEDLLEDERLFIGMIHRLNEQAAGVAAEEGAMNIRYRSTLSGQWSSEYHDAKPKARPFTAKGSLLSRSTSESTVGSEPSAKKAKKEN